MNIYEKLLKVQSELKAPKGQYNAFGKYKYRSCEDIQEAVKPLLGEVNAILTVSDEIKLIGDRYYIEATARFIDCESIEIVENKAFAREELDKKGMDSSQITGSASSYARKYALNGLFCIDDVKDSDTTNTGEDKKSPADSKKTTPSQTATNKPTQQNDVPKSESEMNAAQQQISTQKIGHTKVDIIKKELERTGVAEKAICTRYEVKKLDDITEELFIRVMGALKKTKSKEAA